MSAKMKPRIVRPAAVQEAHDKLSVTFKQMEQIGLTIASIHNSLGKQYAELEKAHDKLLGDNEKLASDNEDLRKKLATFHFERNQMDNTFAYVKRLEAEIAELKAKPIIVEAPKAPEPRRKFDPEHAATVVVTITNVHVSQDGCNVGFAVTDLGEDVYIPSHLMAKAERDASGLKGDKVRLTVIPNERTDYRAVRYLGPVE